MVTELVTYLNTHRERDLDKYAKVIKEKKTQRKQQYEDDK